MAEAAIRVIAPNKDIGIKTLMPHISFSGTCEETKTYYADVFGGEVILPLRDTFRGPHFGMIKNKFGIGRMFRGEPGKD